MVTRRPLSAGILSDPNYFSDELFLRLECSQWRSKIEQILYKYGPKFDSFGYFVVILRRFS